MPEVVDDAQGVVALLHFVHQDPDGDDVMDVVQVPSQLGVSLHLPVNAVDVLGAAGHFGLEARLLQLLLQRVHGLLDQQLLLGLPPGQQVLDMAVLQRLEVVEGQVLELRLDLPYAQTVGQRGIDLQGLPGHGASSGQRQGLQRAHVVQAVGQLDEDHPQVLRHGHQHLPQALRLQVVAGGLLGHLPRYVAQLGHPVHQLGHVRAELLLYLLHRHTAVLRHIVKERRRDGGGVELQIRQNGRRFQWMLQIRLARAPELALMSLERELVGLSYNSQFVR